jgi:hypothetical protein
VELPGRPRYCLARTARWPVGSGARLAHALLLVALLAMTRVIGFVLLARVTGRGDLGVIDGWTFAALLAASVLSLGGVIGLGLVVWGGSRSPSSAGAPSVSAGSPEGGAGRARLLRHRPAHLR